MSSAILVSKIVDSIKNLVSTEAAEKNETELPVCQDPTDLGKCLKRNKNGKNTIKAR